MRLPTSQRLPNEDIALVRLLTDIAAQVNSLTEGRMAGRHAAMTAAPTAGSYAQGDVVLNSTPAEAGGSPNKYVVTHFICTVGGTPGTWLSCRSLTGN